MTFPLDTCDVLGVVFALPAPVADLLREAKGRLMLAGGFIRATIACETPRDIDLFATSMRSAEEYAARLGPTTVSLNAKNSMTGGIKTQVVQTWTFQTPQDLLRGFDFTVAQAVIWWDGAQWQSMRDARFYDDLQMRVIRYTHPDEHDSSFSFVRMLRFAAAGYTVDGPSLVAVVARASLTPEPKEYA